MNKHLLRCKGFREHGARGLPSSNMNEYIGKLPNVLVCSMHGRTCSIEESKAGNAEGNAGALGACWRPCRLNFEEGLQVRITVKLMGRYLLPSAPQVDVVHLLRKVCFHIDKVLLGLDFRCV